MRFDAPEYVDDWKRTGLFPSIHDAVYRFISEHVEGLRFLALCSSTGLLGWRLQRKVRGAFVCGVEADAKAIAKGRAAGVDMPVLELRIDPQTLGRLREFVREQRVEVLVARRCIPELFDGRAGFGREFVAMLAAAGVREVVLQGRVPTIRAVNEFSSVDGEIALFSTRYKLARREKQLALLNLLAPT